MTGEDGRIRGILNDLKQRGLVRDRVALIIDDDMPSSKASLLKRSIRINPAYAALSDDGVRFILLHEEGHMVFFQRTLAILASLALLLIPVGIILSNVLPSVLASMVGFVISVVTIVVVFRSTSEIRHEDEFRSDLHAARILQEQFGVRRPSLVAKECFDHDVMDVEGVDLLLLMGRVLETHPDVVERVRRVKDELQTVCSSTH